MPLYEYKCHSCGKTFEIIQKFSDDPLQTHAECGGPVERLISPPAFQFKGSGWYVTDYARGSGSASGSKSDGSKGSETKTETSKSDSAATSSSESKSSSGTTPGSK